MMLDKFKDLQGYAGFVAPNKAHGDRAKMKDEVSLTITKNAHSNYHTVMFNFGVNVLSKIGAVRGDKLEISPANDGKSVAFRKGPVGWMLTSARKSSTSQHLVCVAEYYFGKTYTKKLGKMKVDYAIFGDCIIVDISKLDRLAG